MVIDHGVIIADDTARALKSRLAGDRITVTVAREDDDTAASVFAELGRDLTRRPVADGAELAGRVDDGVRALPALLRTLDAAGVRVLTADVRVPTLDDVFLSLTGRSLRETSEVAA